MKKVLIVNDNTYDQTNGVNMTYIHLQRELMQMGYRVEIFRPDHFTSVPCPLYKDFSWTLDAHKVKSAIKKFKPHYIHIATEGPLGVATKLYCDRKKIKYTTAYHTKFPEYLENFSNQMIKSDNVYPFLKWFHKKSEKVFVTTKSMKEELEAKGFKRLVVWTRGVDHTVFKMNNMTHHLDEPVWVTCSRVSSEKNIEVFCEVPVKGKKIFIGDGPMLPVYKEKYPHVEFVGKKDHIEMSKILNGCDVFVFPSLTDTFGIVIIEALACGLPVVGFDVPGPRDILNNDVGLICPLDDKANFKKYCEKALKIDKVACYRYGKSFTWKHCAEIFANNMAKR